MKRRHRLSLILALACPSLLGSCNAASLFFASFFPAELSQAAAAIDLSRYIPEEAGTTFEIAVETSGVPESDYVILFSRDSFTGSHLFIFDSGLSDPPLQRLDALPAGFDGRCTIAALSGEIVFGNAAFLPSSASTAVFIWPHGALYNPSFSLPEYGMSILNIRVQNYRQLACDGYYSDWTNAPIPPNLIRPEGNFSVMAAFADRASAMVFLLLAESDSQTAYCLAIPVDEFAGISPVMVPSGGLLELYPPLVTLDDIPQHGEYGFAAGVFVLYDEETRDYTVYDLPAGTVRRTLHDPIERDRRISAYNKAGTAYYTFDTRKRTVTTYAAWWGP